MAGAVHRFYLPAEVICQALHKQRRGCTELFPFATCSPFPITWTPKLLWAVKQKRQEKWDVKDTAGWSSQPGVTLQESWGDRNSSDALIDLCTKIISWALQPRDSYRFLEGFNTESHRTAPWGCTGSSGHTNISLHLISGAALSANFPNPVQAGSFWQMKKVPCCCSLKELCAAKLIVGKVFCWPQRTMPAKPYC